MLAAASLGAAARVLKLPDIVRETLLDDLACYGVAAEDIDTFLVPCEVRFLELWEPLVTRGIRGGEPPYPSEAAKAWGAAHAGISHFSPVEILAELRCG